MGKKIDDQLIKALATSAPDAASNGGSSLMVEPDNLERIRTIVTTLRQQGKRANQSDVMNRILRAAFACEAIADAVQLEQAL